MSFAYQKHTHARRTKKVRKDDGWRWLWRSIQTWLWAEANRPQGARQHNRLTPAQKKLRRWISNQLYYQKNRDTLTLHMRETRKFCPEVRDKWEAARRQKRAQS